MRKLWRFKGGIQLPGFKSASNSSSIQHTPIPRRLYIPLHQHIGEPAKPIVQIGEHVWKGQCVADSRAHVSAPIHASSSGTVVDIKRYPIPHQSGLAALCIVIETDGKDEWHPDIRPVPQPDLLSTDEIRIRIRNAGIVGLGGAVFPSAAKLKSTTAIKTLIINGVECEPYITCDDALMRLKPDTIVKGAALLQKIIQPQECLIAVEDNKPESISALEESLAELQKTGLVQRVGIQVIAVPTRFPTGGEKQLIKVLTGKEVPQRGLPFEVGVVCLNVGTISAVYSAIYDGKPLVSRIVTVTGPQVRHPANFDVLIGTPIEELIAAAGGFVSNNYKLIMGGPMMGQRLPHGKLPTVKASNCILVENDELQQRTTHMPCIRCGACASACPIGLLPQQLYWHARGNELNKLTHYNLTDCIECGCCAVVCPAKIPLVHYFRYAKSELVAQQNKKAFADQSRHRMQAREERIERIKHEQAERKARRKAARKKQHQAEPARTDITQSASKASSG